MEKSDILNTKQPQNKCRTRKQAENKPLHKAIF